MKDLLDNTVIILPHCHPKYFESLMQKSVLTVMQKNLHWMDSWRSLTIANWIYEKISYVLGSKGLQWLPTPCKAVQIFPTAQGSEDCNSVIWRYRYIVHFSSICRHPHRNTRVIKVLLFFWFVVDQILAHLYTEMLLNMRLAFREAKQCMTTGKTRIGIKGINPLLRNDKGLISLGSMSSICLCFLFTW